MKFDLHTHHERCGHADGNIEDYIQAAIDANMKAIGISDHSPYFHHESDHPFSNITMARSDFGNYIKEVLELKEKYKNQIEVLLGIESDFFPDHAAVYRQYYKDVPFDYLIGSVHYVDGVSIFNKNRWKKMNEAEKIQTKEAYYDLIAQSAKSGMFDILGHIDAMKAYYPEFSQIPAQAAIERALRTIADCGTAIEINTSGRMKLVGGWYPSDEILEKAYHFGVQVTFGSDSHVPERVGEDFENVAAKLKDIGYKQWVFFRQRKRIAVPL